MTDADAALAQIRQSLVESAIGNYLRNTVRMSVVTCAKCAGYRQGYHQCYKCEFEYPADVVGSMIYAGDGLQSGRLMYGYKSAAPGPSHVQTVRLLASLGLVGHIGCAGGACRSAYESLGDGAVTTQNRLRASIPGDSHDDPSR